jgi:hypothetical protein
MSAYLMINPDILNDPTLQRLPAKKFRKLFLEASAGAKNDFSRFVKGPYFRLPTREWQAVRALVFERDNFTCTYCGTVNGPMECDHIHPVSKGGSSDMSNLTTACFKCNRSKRSKTVDEWLTGKTI